MFGGYGVYADGLCFAIEIDGEVALGYRRLLAPAYDDEDDLRRWAALGLAAARRAATAKRAKVAGSAKAKHASRPAAVGRAVVGRAARRFRGKVRCRPVVSD
jgi:DNA transformation protein